MDQESVNNMFKRAEQLVAGRQYTRAIPLLDILSGADIAAASKTAVGLLHCTALVESRQFDAAVHVIERLIGKDGQSASEAFDVMQERVKVLQAGMQSMVALHRWKAASTYAARILEQVETMTTPDSEWAQEFIDARANACCTLGKCAEANGAPDSAAAYFRDALALDPLCSEAIDALIEHRLLPPSELLALINQLQLPPECEPLRTLHKVKLDAGNDTPTTDSSAPPSISHLGNAKAYYQQNNLIQALDHSTKLLELQPLSEEGVTLHLSILVDSRSTSQLFAFAHRLADRGPHEALSLYAIGCYYYMRCQFERAGRFFSKVTELAPTFPPGWVAYGHCYAQLEEGEQALSVYRKAQALFPGMHRCSAYLGMQYSRVHSWTLAMNFLDDARRKMPNDTLVLNEIGVLYMKTGKLEQSHQFLMLAKNSMPNQSKPSQYVDCVLFNLATVKRKLGDLDKALELFHQYVKHRPNAAHGYTALGFTYHLKGDLREAIAHYTTSLGIKPDAFCREVCDRAVADVYSSDVGGPSWMSNDVDRSSPGPGQAHHSFNSSINRSQSYRGPRTPGDAVGGPSPSPAAGARILTY